MTPEQEKELMDTVAGLKTTVTSLQTSNQKLVTDLAERDKTIDALRKDHTALSQDAASKAFKAAYPDVPLEVFHSTPAEKRDEVAKAIQEGFTKAKGSRPKDPTGTDLWADAGGLTPTTDAEAAAIAADQQKKMLEAKNRGDVFSMIKLRSGEIKDHLRRALQTPVRA